MLLRALVFLHLLAGSAVGGHPSREVPYGPTQAGSAVRAWGVPIPACRSIRQLTLTEMVSELDRGCLALDDVRFLPGQDTIESLSPAQFALLARALGMAQGAFRVTVPPEAAPGGTPDTLQARRRGTRLRDELVHYGASSARLLEDPGWPMSQYVAAPGGAVPMLIRVPSQ